MTDSTLLQQAADIRALVVDDDSMALRIVCSMLQRLGVQADAALGGFEAMDRVRQGSYDLLLSDLKMPGIDGFSLSCWIRNRSENIKLVIMTGHSRDEMADYIKTGRVDYWLFKPFGLSDLRHVIRELFGQLYRLLPESSPRHNRSTVGTLASRGMSGPSIVEFPGYCVARQAGPRPICSR